MQRSSIPIKVSKTPILTRLQDHKYIADISIISTWKKEHVQPQTGLQI